MACYFPFYSPYIKLDKIHRDLAVKESMQSLVTHQQEVPLKGRVMIIKRKREIRIKLEREHQECKSRKNSHLSNACCCVSLQQMYERFKILFNLP